MIFVDRNAVPIPSLFLDTNERRQRALNELKSHFARPYAQRRQIRFKFAESLYTAKDVREALSDLFRGKCAYCESIVGAVAPAEIDEFRPKSFSMDLYGTISDDYYWWLAYEWSNLYASCPICNRNKGRRFPVAGPRATVGLIGPDLAEHEQALVVDPCRDSPDEHFVFDDAGTVAGLTKQGNVSIDLFGLNRIDLVEARRRELQRVLFFVDNRPAIDPTKWLNELSDEVADPDRAYLAAKRQVLARALKRRAGVKTEHTTTDQLSLMLSALANIRGSGDYSGIISAIVATLPAVVAFGSRVKKLVDQHRASERSEANFTTEGDFVDPAYYRKTRHIERVEIKDFRRIKHLELDFRQSASQFAPWTMLLGENGAGKSSILQAICLALIGNEYRSRLNLNAASFIRKGAKSATVIVHLANLIDPVTLHVTPEGGFAGQDRLSKVLILGYGATRLIPRAGTTADIEANHAKVDNLFDPFVPVGDVEKWLLTRKKSVFDVYARALKELLISLDGPEEIVRRGGVLSIDTRYGTIPISMLSDGYQSVIGVTADVMRILSRYWEAMEVAEGIVVIDELGAHLHPRWRMRVVSGLRRAFPRIQFITSTHDPLCLRGLVSGEVIVLRLDERGEVKALCDLPPVDAMTVEQLLTSELFGLYSTVDPELDAKFLRYMDLLASDENIPGQADELEELKSELDRGMMLGRDRRERMVLEVIDEHLSKEKYATSTEERELQTKKAKVNVLEIWKSVVPDDWN
ncbi:MAG: DUF2813 domain-containing protein [Mesorhizobium sp.]|uniref:AAA family ATPase n=1 Tax=Mesorhizobium sp. TaxID=1871066 RepID=UPI00121D13FC|nr:AAA family ATPase [Mesorhizobium sp.]TIP29614.1 MAG: DUF2813 domain-containing protein [Mesorhizobium sp.]